MTFPYFDIRWVLLLVPLVAALVVAGMVMAQRRRDRRLEGLAGGGLVRRLVPASVLRRNWWRAPLLASAVALATVAFAGPRWGLEQAVVRGEGADIVLALDASLSMLAPDDRPNRLERMKQEARRLVALSGGDRFGVLAFAGRSYILTPLTVDRGALELYLDNLDPGVVGQPGSSIARTIRQGTDLLMATPTGSDRAIVVMSDGEAHEPVEDIVAAAQRAAQEGIMVITVGFGTEQGGNIPRPASGGGTVLHRDQDGQVVVTRYSPETLQAIAQAGNGVFIASGETDKATRVRQAMASLRREVRQTQAGADMRSRFQLFLIPAMLLVMLDTLLTERRGRTRGRRARGLRNSPARATVAALLAVLMLLAPRPALADDFREGERHFAAGRYLEAAAAYNRLIRRGDASPQVLYNYGTALMAAGRGDQAIEPLERAANAGDADLRYRALFNLGLLYLERGRGLEGEAAEQGYAAAVEAYRRALRVTPSDPDAKWNYELALREQRQAGGGGGGAGEQQPQQQDPRTGQAESPTPRPSGGIDQQQAEQILESAARDESEVQARRQREGRSAPPVGGRDW
jgi:Ca-activated chloride channel homolog